VKKLSLILVKRKEIHAKSDSFYFCAICFVQQNERLFLQMLDVEYQAHPVDEEKVMMVFQTILASDLSIEFKVKISQRRMEFLEDFGTCIKRSVFLFLFSIFVLFCFFFFKLNKGVTY
jgi:hypothetical protein